MTLSRTQPADPAANGRRRPYQLGKRGQSMAETRARVIEAAREALSEDQCRSLSMDEIARRAGVARATLYHQFTSKFDLLNVVVAETAGRNDARGVRELRDQPEGARALRQYVPALCTFYASDHILLRNVFGLMAIDPDANRVIESYDANRREGLTQMVRRLSDQGHLSSTFTQAEAVDVLWMLTGFQTFIHLYGSSGLPVEEVASLLLRQSSMVLTADA
jgi:AcrR family transcriptional regulator